ncbi:MAG: beta-propeller fold lactonase family protein [Terriglobales bacterium]
MTRLKKSLCLGFLLLFWSMAALLGCGGNSNMPMSGNQHSSKFLFVVNSDANTVSSFTISAGSAALDMVGAPAPTGANPNYAAVSGNGKFLYVANTGISASSVSGFKIDPASGALTPTTPATFNTTGGIQPLGIAVDPSSTHVYTANVGSISAFNVDSATGALSDVPGTPVFAPAAGAILNDLKISPNGQFLYVTDGQTNTISSYTFNGTGLPVSTGVPVGTGATPVGIVVDQGGKFVYVANMDSNDVSAYRITAATGVLVSSGATAPVGAGCAPQELAVDPTSKFLFVSCSGAGVNAIAQFTIDAMTGVLTPVLPAFTTGLNTTPRGLTVDASGMFVYSALSTTNQAGTAAAAVTGVLTATGTPAMTGAGPIGVTVSGSR